MKEPRVSFICALSDNRVIGRNNQLPWRISEDLRRFKGLTEGHPVIMGRKTFESIGTPLANRTNIVVTSDSSFKQKGVIVCHSLKEALHEAGKKDQEEVFIIGGGQIFAEAIGLADRLYLTLVEGNFEGDTFFPDYSDFKKVIFEQEGQSESLRYKFLDLERD